MEWKGRDSAVNPVKAFGCRAYQRAMYVGMFLLKWREPELLSSMAMLPRILRDHGLKRPLIVTDEGLRQAGILPELTRALLTVPYALFDETPANPTIDAIEKARAVYLREGCDCLIALGGGSPMDLAKAVGARIARPNRTIPRMRGQLKVRRRIPALITIPTTSGTGSETTLAAVVTDSATHQKYAINDTALIPRFAVLDPKLTLGLPPNLTAATGMDALTHAIEAYIGKSTTADTRSASLQAVRLIDENLMTAYGDGTNLHARRAMQQAAYLAGTAFTRAYVGYVHAIAHQLGALYGTPHGLANAILLPHVLLFYGDAIHAPMQALYAAFGGPDPAAPADEKTRYFIGKITALNHLMGIPGRAQINPADIDRIADGAYREATPLYPVPRLLDRAELKTLIRLSMASE